MQYAIIEISGKQFWVEVGKFYNFNRIPCKLGKRIILNRVLLLNNEGKILIGQPFLNNVKIQGKILQHLRDKKKIIYKIDQKRKLVVNMGIDNN